MSLDEHSSFIVAPGPSEPHFPSSVVGIGSSAGGLEALRALVPHLSANASVAYIVAQHTSPAHRSMLSSILGRDAVLPVSDAESGAALVSGQILIIPAGHDAVVKEGRVWLEAVSSTGPRPSVDRLFLSLAQEFRDKACGVILSGTGTDGAHGLRAILAEGGHAIVQDPRTARYNGMPHAALQVCSPDLVLPPEAIGSRLIDLINRGPVSTPTRNLQQLRDLLEERYEVRFAGYKDGTLKRLVARRMVSLCITEVAAYAEFLRANREEVDRLLAGLLISVTSFFRDPTAFQAFKSCLVELVRRRQGGDTLRVWVPACATGEEAYSIAILLDEIFLELAVKGSYKVFATDLDERALTVARTSRYPTALLEQLSPDRFARYFHAIGDLYEIDKSIRERMVFARHDLLSDPPFQRLDIISCRNLLIYLKPEAQASLLARFRSVLLEDGLLFLGKAETPAAGAELFRPLNATARIYLPDRSVADTGMLRPGWLGDPNNVVSKRIARPQTADNVEVARNCLVTKFAPPSVLVDAGGRCLHFFGDLTGIVGISEGTADLRIQNLLIEPLRAPVMALVSTVRQEPRQLMVTVSDELRVECLAEPVQYELMPQVLLAFRRHAPSALSSSKLAVELSDSEGLQALRADLQLTQANLQSLVEELETSNEELQSMNEELQASTEELQSSNEELNAANEELQTVNEELETRTSELLEANAYLEGLQLSIAEAVVVLDSDLRLLRFSPRATQLFDIVPSDVGRHLVNIPRHFANAEFASALRQAINNEEPPVTTVTTEGRTWLMRLRNHHSLPGSVVGVVLAFTDISELRLAQEALRLRVAALDAAAESVVLVDALDPQRPIIHASDQFLKLTGYSEAEVLGRNCKFLQGPATDPETVARITRALEASESFDGDILNYRKDGSRFWNHLRIRPLELEAGHVRYFVGTQTDITEKRQQEQAVQKRANYDSLTGLPNRTLLISRLTRCLESSEQSGSYCYVFFLDLDGFKAVNDVAGHQAGDELLIQVADRLLECVRESDTVARLGGDEFVVVLNSPPNLDLVLRVVTAIRARIREPFELAQGRFSVSASVGIAAYPNDASDPAGLLQAADSAMYRAKQRGRDCSAFHEAKMDQEAGSRLSLKRSLIQGVRDKTFHLVFQPMFKLNGGAKDGLTMVGAEALIRWHGPDGQLLEPRSFLPIAEETGQISAIGLWVLDQAVRVLHNLEGQLPADFRLSVNVATKQLREVSFLRAVERLPSEVLARLDFDIPETALVDRNHQTFESLELLRSRKARVTIEDFGYQHGALRSLHNCLVDRVKIGPLLVHRDLGISKNQALLATAFSLAKAVDAEVYAEAVETVQQRDMLLGLGCEVMQGYLWSRPVPADELPELATRLC